jgi:hypothetical protein
MRGRPPRSIRPSSSESYAQGLVETRRGITARVYFFRALFDRNRAMQRLFRAPTWGAHSENDLWVIWLQIDARRLDVLCLVDRKGANCAVLIFDNVDATEILSDLPVGG